MTPFSSFLCIFLSPLIKEKLITVNIENHKNKNQQADKKLGHFSGQKEEKEIRVDFSLLLTAAAKRSITFLFVRPVSNV